MRARRCADYVKCVENAGYPVAHGFVHGVFERSRAAGHRNNLGAQYLHSENVRRLAADVFFAHEYTALHAEKRRHCCRGYTMLAGAGFGNDFFLPHAARQKRLPQRIINFVGAGMIEVFPFEINFSAA